MNIDKNQLKQNKFSNYLNNNMLDLIEDYQDLQDFEIGLEPKDSIWSNSETKDNFELENETQVLTFELGEYKVKTSPINNSNSTFSSEQSTLELGELQPITDNYSIDTPIDTPIDTNLNQQRNPGFDIEVNFTDNRLTASQRAIFNDAAEKWSRVITGDLPDGNVPGFGFVDDLVIDASAPRIDGNGGTLGQAGPTLLRSGSLLPIRGVMEFDRADLDQLERDGELEDVIVHEMGHVLGIGTVWDDKGLLIRAGSSNPRFTGAGATAEYNRIFGRNASSVPVENTGGPGTRDGHWRESVFGNELMTGFLNSGVSNPLSRVTVASLGDLGYEVNLNRADPFTPPSSLVADTSTDSIV